MKYKAKSFDKLYSINYNTKPDSYSNENDDDDVKSQIEQQKKNMDRDIKFAHNVKSLQSLSEIVKANTKQSPEESASAVNEAILREIEDRNLIKNIHLKRRKKKYKLFYAGIKTFWIYLINNQTYKSSFFLKIYYIQGGEKVREFFIQQRSIEVEADNKKLKLNENEKK